MLRILSWSSGLGCDKVHNPDFNIFVPKQPSVPFNELSLNNSMKRKRSPSFDAQTESPLTNLATMTVKQGETKPPQADAMAPSQAVIKQEPPSHLDLCKSTPSSTMVDIQAADHTTQKVTEKKLRHMRQTISTQLSLEILLKHKELRLIDQEIAKCQVALEQLRRCSEIPYPGTQNPSTLVSEGKGAALRKLGEKYPAKSPAPWGVTDGPYSRHYAKWLLPDPRFDGGEPDAIQLQSIMDAAVPARSTRGSFVEAGKSLKSRTTMRSGNFKSLPAGYGQPKEKATGPMILKRKSDSVMVKLVCPDCGRHDFGSAQGFINHCRIGHSRSFASHDAAAEACGQPIEYHENGTMKGSEPVATPVTGNMHPLIRSAKLLSHASTNTPLSTRALDPNAPRSSQLSSSTDPNFLPSTQTPHLSELIKSHGLGLNLEMLVTDAKTKIDLPESDHDEDDMEIDSPIPLNAGRHPQVAGSKQPAKAVSSKHHSQSLHGRRHFSHHLPGTQRALLHDQIPLQTPVNESQPEFMHPLIPSPTNESTQAPSLVDDDEDFDPQSPVSSDEIDEAEVDFDVQDDEHGERAVLRDGELPAAQTTCTPAPPTRTPTRRHSIVRKPLVPRGDSKEASFTSPSSHSEGSDRKRRKLGEN